MFESWQVSALVPTHLVAHFKRQNLLQLVRNIEVETKYVFALLLATGGLTAGCGSCLNKR